MKAEFTAVFKKVPEGYIGFIEELAGAKELPAEGLRQKPLTTAAGAMKNEHRVADDTRRVPPRRPDGAVVQAELGQRLARREREVADDEVAFDRGLIIRGLGRTCNTDAKRHDACANK